MTCMDLFLAVAEHNRLTGFDIYSSDILSRGYTCICTSDSFANF